MSTLNELINEVCDDLMRNDITAQVSDSVVLAIRHYDNRRWWFSEATATFTCSASVTAYSLPTGFKSFDYVEVTLPGNNKQEVVPRPYSVVKQMNESNAPIGYPEAYAVYGEQFHIAYPPGSTTAIVIVQSYVKSLTDLTAAASNAWTTDGRELIRARAAKQTALRTLHDPQLASMFADMEQDAFNSLQAESNRRTVGSQKIKPYY